MADFKAAKILVTGAMGKLGSAVVEGLVRAGATNVVAGTRDVSKLQGSNVDARALDFDKPETFAAALLGVERMLLISTDAVETPGKRVEQHRRILAAAAQAGVKHIVYTSAPAPMPGAHGAAGTSHFWTEAALFAQPSITWTILRNELYAELLVMGAEHAAASGKIFSATAGRGRAYVTRQNCADAAVGALLTAKESAIFDITGPEALTQDRVAQLLSSVTGKPIAHVGLSSAALHEGLLHAGLPPFLADILVAFDVDAAQGYHDVVTDAVEQLSGHKPTSVEHFLRSALQPA